MVILADIFPILLRYSYSSIGNLIIIPFNIGFSETIPCRLYLRFIGVHYGISNCGGDNPV